MPSRVGVVRSGSAALTRRRWLIGALVTGLGLATRARGADERGSETKDIEQIQARAKGAGLGRFRSSETEHYLGIGDSPDANRERALEICRELATAYHSHFQSKGFPVAFPKQRLTVLTLKNRTSYEKFLGEATGAEVGGHFDVENNRLVIFDFRPSDGEPIANAERVNTFTLVHEGIHQLTYNTGLLDRRGDVPACISEGLATYGELWRPKGRLAFGLSNKLRRDVLAETDLTESWIPVAALLTGDTLFDHDEAKQLAYAQSWLLIHFFLRTPGKPRILRAYLDAIRARRDPSSRIKDASATLGDLDRLDRDLKKHAARRIREG